MKIIGFVFVFLFFLFSGKFLAVKEERKGKICAEIYELLQYISYAVSRNISIDDAIMSFFDKRTDSCLFARNKSQFEVKLRRELGTGDCGGIVPLIMDLLEKSGHLYDVGAVTSLCQEHLKEAQKVYGTYCEESKKKTELYGKLGIILGFGVCFVLL